MNSAVTLRLVPEVRSSVDFNILSVAQGRRVGKKTIVNQHMFKTLLKWKIMPQSDRPKQGPGERDLNS